MFGTYLRRELLGRRRQTIIIAIGMALAIALVIIVNSVAAGVKNAQAQVLRSVYGVGTDVTITKPVSAPAAGSDQARGPRFDFGANSGTESGNGSRTVDSSRLSVAFGTNTMSDSTLATVEKASGVAGASAVLSLQNTSFKGTLPDFGQLRNGQRQGGTQSGGTDGKGGSSFQVNSFSVMGIAPGGKAVGPIASTALDKGRTLSSSDTGKEVAVLDAGYAKSKSLSVGDSVSIGGQDFKIVGTVKPTGSDSATASNVYVPLDVAQKLSSETGKVSTIYVTATSATDVNSLKAALEKALPSATVSTQADLASNVSGSLGSASQLVSNLGTWLSVIVLAAAFLIAILFTISGVTRRTREFGTLKAIGWSNRRIVGQVAGESVVQGVIGGVAGIVIGLVGVFVVNVISPTLTGGVSRGGFGGALAAGARRAFSSGGAGSTGAPGGRFSGGGFGGAARSAVGSATTQVDLSAPITVWVIAIAVGLAVLGGLLAGAIGGWRASRLRPAEALRSVQ